MQNGKEEMEEMIESRMEDGEGKMLMQNVKWRRERQEGDCEDLRNSSMLHL